MKLEDFKALANRYPEFDKFMDTVADAAIAASDITTDYFFDEDEEVAPPPYKRIRLMAYRIAYRRFFSIPKTERQKKINHKILWGEPLERRVRRKKVKK